MARSRGDYNGGSTVVNRFSDYDSEDWKEVNRKMYKGLEKIEKEKMRIQEQIDEYHRQNNVSTLITADEYAKKYKVD